MERTGSLAGLPASPVDVFIGMNCLILNGVTIGQQSVVSVGSVVTRNVWPGDIVAGNPAAIAGSVADL